MTPAFAITREPRESVMLMMAGKSCGVMPTASATEKSSESITGFLKRTLTTNTNTVKISIMAVSRYPNCRIPRSNSVSGGREVICAEMSPNSVLAPVCVMSTVALPVRTTVPINTQLSRLASSVSAGTVPDRFSTGTASPVSTD